MDQVQIENIAKAATDSFFASMTERERLDLMANTEIYLQTYTKVYLQALKEVTKTIEAQKTKEELGKQFL